jgi:hypothetical protein
MTTASIDQFRQLLFQKTTKSHGFPVGSANTAMPGTARPDFPHHHLRHSREGGNPSSA